MTDVLVRARRESKRRGPLDAGGLFLRFLALLACYYLAYRYPFQINSRLTSPTYFDTPLALQLGKYLLFAISLALVLITSSLRSAHRPFTPTRALTAILYLYLFAYPLAQGLVARDLTLCQTGLFFSALFPFVVFSFRERAAMTVGSDVTRFLYAAIAVEAAQIALFLLFGRLPALAYSESLSVRFGSLWDDPNGFGVFLSFLVGIALFGNGPLPRKVLLAVILGCMLLVTQSLTAIAATLLAPVVVLLLAIRATQSLRWVRALVLLTMLYVVVALVACRVFAESDWVDALVASKSRSAGMHVEGYAALGRADVAGLLGLSPEGVFGEPGYVNLLLNHGTLYTIAYVLAGLLAVRRLLTAALTCPAGPARGLYWGALLFLASYYLAMFNLPIEQVFPLNLFLVITVILSELSLNAGRADSLSEAPGVLS
jgi:hypothetical protein